MLLIAADHTARGKLAVGSDPHGRRGPLHPARPAPDLPRRPGVDGVLASADVLEELALLGALDGRLAVGTMNRGGIAGARWELDDRLTAYDAEHVVVLGLDGGKTLLRIDPTDPGVAAHPGAGRPRRHRSSPTRASWPWSSRFRTARAPTEGSSSTRPRTRSSAPSRSPAASGSSSAHTWLKVPATADPARVAAATTCPILLLGGDAGRTHERVFGAWERALAVPNIRGLVPGRALLYPRGAQRSRGRRRAAPLVHPSESHPVEETAVSNHHRAGTLSSADTLVTVTPEQAGWTYCGLEVFDLGTVAPVSRVLDGDRGRARAPVGARRRRHRRRRAAHALQGGTASSTRSRTGSTCRSASEVTLSAAPGEVALCTARATERHPVHVTAAADVPVEVRGGGRASRQVTNIATPDSFTGADRINVCEVLTPGGNVSSWPPHRHDGIGDCAPTNEEIYYFRMGRLDAPHGHPHGQGLFRVYTVDGSSDETVTVSTATCTSSARATTARRPPSRSTRCTSSTCSPARARSAPWPSATTPTTTGSARPGTTRGRTRGCR